MNCSTCNETITDNDRLRFKLVSDPKTTRTYYHLKCAPRQLLDRIKSLWSDPSFEESYRHLREFIPSDWDLIEALGRDVLSVNLEERVSVIIDELSRRST